MIRSPLQFKNARPLHVHAWQNTEALLRLLHETGARRAFLLAGHPQNDHIEKFLAARGVVVVLCPVEPNRFLRQINQGLRADDSVLIYSDTARDEVVYLLSCLLVGAGLKPRRAVLRIDGQNLSKKTLTLVEEFARSRKRDAATIPNRRERLKMKLAFGTAGALAFLSVLVSAFLAKKAAETMVQDYSLSLARVIGSQMESDLRNAVYRSEDALSGRDADYFRQNPAVVLVRSGTRSTARAEINADRSSLRDDLSSVSAKPGPEVERVVVRGSDYLIFRLNQQVVVFSASRLLGTFRAPRQSGLFQVFLVDRQGNYLLSTSEFPTANGRELPIVSEMLSSSRSNGSMRYADRGRHNLGSYQTLGFSGLGIVSFVESRRVLEAVYREWTGRGSEEEIGKITYRYPAAQRRGSGRVFWEDTDQKQAIYNGDALRTDERSEALVTLAGGAILELDPQSLIHVSTSGSRSEIELSQGSLLVRKPSGKESVLFHQGGRTQAILPKGEFRLTVSEGAAEARGSFEMERNGDTLQSDRDTVRIEPERVERIRPAFSDLFPPDNFRVFTEKDRLDIPFSWSGQAQTLEISDQRTFGSVTQSQVVKGQASLRVPFSDGLYYWRLTGEGKSSEVHKFRMVRTLELQMISPPGEVKLSESQPLVPFEWSETRLAASYRLVIARDAEMKKTAVDRELQRTSVAIDLAPGEYYWQVEAVGALPGSNSRSAVKKFLVTRVIVVPSDTESPKEAAPEKQDTVLGRPSVVSPPPGSSVDLSSRDNLVFHWTAVPGAQRYAIIIYQLKGGKIQVYRVDTGQTVHTLKDLSVLDSGEFACEVRAYAGKEETTSGLSQFSVTLNSRQPRRP